MDYQLIVFDWDGTLMDSTAHITHCMHRAISTLSLEPLSDTQVSHIIGLGLHEAVQTLYPDADAATWTALADCYRQTWVNTPESTPLFAHAEALLSRLNEQNILLGVATGKSRRGLDKALQQTGLGDLFISTRCADECYSKPHPQMLMELIDYAGVASDQTLMIGDTEFDLMMAHNAGADSLGITHGAHPELTLKAANPRAIVHDLYQVEKWLARPDTEF